jgi:hypothetical protein
MAWTDLRACSGDDRQAGVVGMGFDRQAGTEVLEELPPTNISI